MSKEEFCRLCANLANFINSQNLFELSQRILLQQVEELTGLQLKNTKELPQLICAKCSEQTRQAHQFREICIRAQQYFAAEEYRIPIAKPASTENRISEDDEVAYESSNVMVVAVSNETCRIKTQQLKQEEKQLKPDSEVIMQKTKAEYNAAEKLIQSKINSNTVAHELKPTKKMCKFPRKAKSNLICDQCGRHFKCRSNFVIHMRRHTGIKPFQCELCPEKFNANWDLKRHVRNHTGELPYPCRYCERRFREISSRTRHERNHTNVRPFACSQCDKSFTQSQSLKNHMLTHTGERAFECKMCNVFFKRKTHLVTHCRSLMHKHIEQQQLPLGSTTHGDVIQECDISQKSINIQ